MYTPVATNSGQERGGHDKCDLFGPMAGMNAAQGPVRRRRGLVEDFCVGAGVGCQACEAGEHQGIRAGTSAEVPDTFRKGNSGPVETFAL